MTYSLAIDTWDNGRQSETPLRVVRFCAILAVVLLIVPVYFYTETENFYFDSSSLYFIGLIFVSSLALAVYGSAANPRPISTTLFAFIYVFLGISPLLQIGLRQYPWGGSYTESEIQKAALIIGTGLIGYLLGSEIAGKIHGRFNRTFGVGNVFDPRKVFLVSLVFIPLVLGCMQYLGGVARLFTPRLMQDDLAVLTSVSAALANNGLYVPCTSFFLIFLSTCLSNKYGSKNFWWSRGGTALWLLIVLIVANPIGTPRYIFGAVVVAILYFNTLKNSWIWSMFLVFTLLLVFPLADMFRYSLTVSAEHMPPAYEQIVYKPDFDAFQQVVNTVQYVENRGLENGLQTVGSMLFFVPREMWPDKPFPTGQLIGEAMGYSMLNLSEPLWGEFYIDGGLAAVLIGFICYGIFIGVIEGVANVESFRGLAGVICIFFGAYQMYFLRGSLMVVISYFIPFICLFALCWKTCRVPAEQAS